MSATADSRRAPASLPLDFPAEPAAGPAREKSRDAFRTISEVGEELDVPAHVLRFWETKFPQVSPMKRGGGRRYYRPADVALLRGIRAALYDEGLTIKGLQSCCASGACAMWLPSVRGPRRSSRRLPEALRRPQRGSKPLLPSFLCCATGFAGADMLAPGARWRITRSVRAVAQSGSASVWGTEGREFESRRPDHFIHG